MATRRFVSKEITFNPATYIGEYGELWVGDDDTTLRVGNNTTPGGVVVSGGGVSDPIELTVTGYSEDIWANATVHFIKENYGNQIDEIDTQVAITRGNNQGIYNPITEGSYDSNLSPEYTLWNIDGWQNLSNVPQRDYYLWSDIINGNPPGLIGSELVMYDTYNNKYHALKFLTWQWGNEGGAFSYIRREINTEAYFNKLDNEGNVDIVSSEVHIVRDDYYGAIYNNVTEGGWDENISPEGTLWNQDGWDNLTDVESRQYLTFYTCVGAGNIGKRVLGTKFVMKDVANNAYYTIMFTHWTPGGNGGGFSYIRQKIDLLNPQSGITFADGTNQTTAFTEQRLGIVPTSTIDYTYDRYLSVSDIGKSITLTDTAVLYIPDYADQPIPVGSVITIINLTGSSIEISKDNDDEDGTIYGAGTSDTSTTWYLPDNGGGNIATLIKISQTYDGSDFICNWMICGSGITV